MLTNNVKILFFFFSFLILIPGTVFTQDNDCEQNCNKKLEWLEERVVAAQSSFNISPTNYNKYALDYLTFTYEAYVFQCEIRCLENVLIDPNFCVRTYWDFHKDHVKKYEGTFHEVSMLALLDWLMDILGCEVP